MERALSAAASGMDAQEVKMSVIANNLANVNTTGFKKSRAEFQDMLYDNLRVVGGVSSDGTQLPTGLQVGQGVRTAATLRIFSEGDLRQTNNALDVAIEGEGFLQVQQMSTGQIAYTRDGALKTDAQGHLVTLEGQPIQPSIIVPQDSHDLAIGADGTVTVVQGGTNLPVHLGQITLVQFANASGLTPLGHNLLQESSASGPPIIQTAGTNGVGTFAQGFLEGSNVKAVDEMIDLITTQRAYEMGTRVLQAVDQMLASTSNLR